jgi:hypothetical protein
MIAAREHDDRLFVGYGDGGTGGALDAVHARHGAERLPGAHCYEFFAGAGLFAQLHDAEPTTFYLTDFLLRQFDRLVWRGLGLDRWPHLRNDYFGNYTRLLYLSQLPPSDDQLAAAQRAADRLGLRLEHRHVGMGDVTPALRAVADGPDDRVVVIDPDLPVAVRFAGPRAHPGSAVTGAQQPLEPEAHT